MGNTPENVLKEYVKSQDFSSTAQIMEAMKDMFKDVLEQVMECELEQNLGFKKVSVCQIVTILACPKTIAMVILKRQ